MYTLSVIMAQATIHMHTLFASLPSAAAGINPKTAQLVSHLATILTAYAITVLVIGLLLRYHTTRPIHRGGGVGMPHNYRGYIKLLLFPFASFVFILNYLCAYAMYKLF